MEKGTSQFCWSAGRCGAMRRGVHAGMPLGCPLPAQGMQPPMGMLPSPGHAAAKAKAAPMGRQPRPGHAAAKAKTAPHGHAAKAWACSSQGQGSTPWACSWQGLGMHSAAKAKARSQGRGMLEWARWHAPVRRQQGPWGHAAKALACRVPEGQWQHDEGVACPVGGMPRPWHAIGTPGRPWQHLGGVLQPSPDSLFGHLLLSSPLKSA